MMPEAAEHLLIPAMALACLSWVVPKLLSMVLPEGVRPLILNGLLSTLILVTVVAVFFIVLYVRNGVPLSRILDLGLVGMAFYFGRLALAAGLILAPIMVLSVAALPRTWQKAVW